MKTKKTSSILVIYEKLGIEIYLTHEFIRD